MRKNWIPAALFVALCAITIPVWNFLFSCGYENESRRQDAAEKERVEEQRRAP